MQKILDSYHSGVQVVQVLLLSVDPPARSSPPSAP